MAPDAVQSKDRAYRFAAEQQQDRSQPTSGQTSQHQCPHARPDPSQRKGANVGGESRGKLYPCEPLEVHFAARQGPRDDAERIDRELQGQYLDDKRQAVIAESGRRERGGEYNQQSHRQIQTDRDAGDLLQLFSPERRGLDERCTHSELCDARHDDDDHGADRHQAIILGRQQTQNHEHDEPADCLTRDSCDARPLQGGSCLSFEAHLLGNQSDLPHTERT